MFVPILKPVLERGADEIIYDDIRENCENALQTLKNVAGAAIEKADMSIDVVKCKVCPLHTFYESLMDTVPLFPGARGAPVMVASQFRPR